LLKPLRLFVAVNLRTPDAGLIQLPLQSGILETGNYVFRGIVFGVAIEQRQVFQIPSMPGIRRVLDRHSFHWAQSGYREV
jgi:hypothetical protein